MPVITDAQAPRFDVGGTHAVGLASPSRGAQSTSAWRVRLDPGTVSPEHTLDAEEVFVVLAGAATATLDGANNDVRGGDALIVPPGVPFALANRGDEPFEAVVCMPVGGTATWDGQTAVPPWAA